jgi:2-iminobutanoate/2-iminopropanoate deaminase
MRQQSIILDGIPHDTPIPSACRVGPVLASSGISGRDQATGKLGETAADQARLAFDNMRTILAKGGMGLGDVVKVTVFLAEEALREAIGPYWREAFPDPARRPARHALVLPLRGGVLLQLEVLAVAGDG